MLPSMVHFINKNNMSIETRIERWATAYRYIYYSIKISKKERNDVIFSMINDLDNSLNQNIVTLCVF